MKRIAKLSIILVVFLSAVFPSCQTKTTSNQPFKPVEVYATPERPPGQTDVLELRAEPIDTVRMAIIGLGMRGYSAVYRYTFIEGAKIVALADVVPEKVTKANALLKKNNLPKADEYTSEDGWKEICERDDIDLVYIVTNWELHTPIATYACKTANMWQLRCLQP